MPVVEKTSGAKVRVRGIGEFDVGDRADVSTSDAQYLVDERGDFEIVDDGSDADEEDTPEPITHTLEETIDAGKCPWCDEYEGDAVGQHASSAHPDEWNDYKEE